MLPVILLMGLTTLLFPYAGISQPAQDTIPETEEVIVEVNRLRQFTGGKKIVAIDSATLASFRSANLAELLAQHSQFFIKSYGPGNLATISSRGTGAGHTAVLWNGFNLQGPMLGQCDFSLFPMNFADEVLVQYGGAGALFGSGAVGGAVYLNSPARYGQGLSATLSSTAGSFSRYQQSAGLQYSSRRFISSLKLFNLTAKNDFPFLNTALEGIPKRRQQNAQVMQRGILQENHFKFGDGQQLNLRIWIQGNERGVPPVMTAGESEASLRTRFCRLSSEWKKVGEHATWFLRSAYFNEMQEYRDLLSGEFSHTRFQTSITEAETNIYLAKNHLLNFGVNNTFNRAVSAGYADIPRQNRTSLFTSYKLTGRWWKGTLSLREELVDGRPVPLAPSAGWEGTPLKGVSVKGNISRNYRLPTFNDLHWNPGGNPDLLPESGWSEEVTLAFRRTVRSFKTEVSGTIYNSRIRNWILWLPGAGYWSPQNIQLVWARGMESTFKLDKEAGDLKLSLSLMYSYVVSTNEKSKSLNDASLGKQLIYVPLYSGQGSLALTYKKFHLSYVHTYTGNRFTSADNAAYIKGYQLGNLSLSKTFLMQRLKGTASLRINNLWNTSYQAVQWQAMPLRYAELGVSFFFHKPLNEN